MALHKHRSVKKKVKVANGTGKKTPFKAKKKTKKA